MQVKLSGSHLTPQCYFFITYVQVQTGSSFQNQSMHNLDTSRDFKWHTINVPINPLQGGEPSVGGADKKKKKNEVNTAATVRTFLIFIFF